MEQHYLYWYHLPKHTDPYSEGYIGLTNDITRRNLEHIRSAQDSKKSTHFSNAINKYTMECISLDILHIVATRDEASELEAIYRPTTNIAWNMTAGGAEPLASKAIPVSLYHKDSYPILHKFKSATEASKVLGIEQARISKALREGITSYGVDNWAVLHDPTTDRSKTLTVNEVLSKALSGKKRSTPSHFKGMTNRWSDEDKQRISKQHKGKIISEEQKRVVSEKNKLNHTLCKQIQLKHKDTPNDILTFHSISEASRQLDIPLSRLKSKALRPINKFGRDGWAIHSLGSE